MISDERLAELAMQLEMALHAKEGHRDRLNIIRSFFALVLKESERGNQTTEEERGTKDDRDSRDDGSCFTPMGNACFSKLGEL